MLMKLTLNDIRTRYLKTDLIMKIHLKASVLKQKKDLQLIV
jgi:hypothetical protein